MRVASALASQRSPISTREREAEIALLTGPSEAHVEIVEDAILDVGAHLGWRAFGAFRFSVAEGLQRFDLQIDQRHVAPALPPLARVLCGDEIESSLVTIQRVHVLRNQHQARLA